MKPTLLRLLPLLALAFAPPAAPAAEKSAAPAFANEGERIRAALTAADDERLAATKAGDAARLGAILSDDLHYTHSSGKVDTKASLIASLASKASVYESFDYKKRTFTLIGSGIATMTGRVITKVGPPGKPNELDLSFLAIWREENGKWRFLAWQSCKMPAPVAAK
ncbi:MAG: nuclear transport factor 2 family protein [Verrucomicrobia bacterium]|nr:nuclear transport factor 2 family protein [Verrucomicrobiota bacterium]